MNTPQKTIDLSKCKVGQRVRLRNRQEERIVKINTGHPYPYACKNGITWDEHGLFQHGKEHMFDIVAILPPAKKAAKKPAKKGATNKQWEAGKAKILRILDELEGLLKP